LNDELIVNPTFSQMEESKLDLIVVGTKQAIAMVEAGDKRSHRTDNGRSP